MTFALGSLRRSPLSALGTAGALIALVAAGCASHPGAGSPAGSGGASETSSNGGAPGGSGSGAGATSGSGGAGATGSTSSTSSTSSSSGGAGDVCGAGSGTVAWTASIPPSAAGLGLVDIAAGPTNDVIVADTAGPATFEQHRWSSKGAFVSTHQDTAGTYTGPMFTSGLFIDAGNDAFYGVLLTGPQGTSTEVKLLWNRITAAGSTNFSLNYKKTLPTSSGAPSVDFFAAGGDASANLHGAFRMGAPAYLGTGVYCYTYAGSDLGASAANLTGNLTSKDFIWPSQDNDLVLFEPLTATTNFGCGAALTVPAAGGVALGKFSGAGSCLWNKLLALPTAAVKATNFRLGADGSMLAAVVYSGTINFGGGALVSTGTSSLALARFDSGGTLLWAKSFGGAGSSFEIGSVGANATGSVILSAGYAGTVDLGGGALPAGADTFVAVFDSSGNHKWSKPVTVGSSGALLAAPGKCGLVLATNSPTVDLGTGALSTVTNGVASIGVAALGM